jgi:hypothetical protein
MAGGLIPYAGSPCRDFGAFWVLHPGRAADETEGRERAARRAAGGISEWPDGSRATSYKFLHALYQEVLYAAD